MTWGAVIHMHSNKVKPDFKSSNRVKLYAVVVAQEYNRHPKGHALLGAVSGLRMNTKWNSQYVWNML